MKRTLLLFLAAALLLTAACGGPQDATGSELSFVPSVTLTNGEPENVPEEPSAEADTGEKAAYRSGNVNMEATLPEGWTWQTVEPDDPAENRPAGSFGLRCWPEADPDLTVQLLFYPDDIGLCGTGVTFTDRTLPSGISATLCTEETQTGMWAMLLYNGLAGAYAGECATTKDLWAAYETDILALLDSALLAQGLATQSQVEEAANAVGAKDYPSVRYNFDHQSGEWTAACYKDGGTEAALTVRLDSQGRVLETRPAAK